MQYDLQKQNEILKAKISQLEIQIKCLSKKQIENKQLLILCQQKKQIIQNDQKTCNTIIDISPIRTSESLQDDTVSFDKERKSKQQQPSYPRNSKHEQMILNSQKPISSTKYQPEQNLQQESNQTNSQISKNADLEQNELKKSTEPPTQNQQPHNKGNYSSAIKQKNVCEECILKMHQIHQMEFLKNKYHKQYISVRSQLDKLRSEQNQNDSHQTQRNSLNLTDIYYDHGNQQKSEKSSFSFQNIENTLLSQRFSLEIEEFVKLIDRLLPLDKKFIELESTDYKLLGELQMKIQKLKHHLGMDTEPKYLEDLFTQLQKSQQSIKKIHQKYKKLFEKVVKVHKQKIKRVKQQFNQVNERAIIFLKDLSLNKAKNQMLTLELEKAKNQAATISNQLKDSKSVKDPLSNQTASIKDLSQLPSLHASRTNSADNQNNSNIQKQMQKANLKLKNQQKINKKLDKQIKQLQLKVAYNKKKAQIQLNQFMNSIIFHSHSKFKSIMQQTQIQDEPLKQKQLQSKTQLQRTCLVQEIGSLVYEIFSFTSCESDEDQNVFLPQTKQQILKMLNHIKRFAQKFDLWQKDKQKQMNEFQKNFLHLLKFFIDSFKVSEEDLLEQVSKMKDNQPLTIYIKKYYSKATQLTSELERVSSTYTFGQKSQSYKQSEAEREV